ncbi:MAG: hypothetical protein AB7O73_13030 [Bacteroidia bacterium]
MMFKFLEKLWMVGAGIGIVSCVFFLIQKDNDSALFFFGFFIISGTAYFVRRSQRIKQEKHLNEIKSKKKAGN